MQEEGSLQARVPGVVFLERPEKNILTSNRFSPLGLLLNDEHTAARSDSGHDPGPRPVSVPPPLQATLPAKRKAPASVTVASVQRLVSVTTSVPTPGRILIKLPGFVGSTPAVVLVDCGATGNFVSKSFASANGFRLASSPDTVQMANGHLQPADGVYRARLSIGSYRDSLDLTATTLEGYDVILGMPWLHQFNPKIDWREHTLSFTGTDYKQHVLRRALTGAVQVKPSNGMASHRLNLVSSKQVEKQHRQGLLEFACVVYPAQMAAAKVSSRSYPPPSQPGKYRSVQ